MLPFASSDTSNAPSFATVTPTGRPHTCPSSITKPVRKSSYSPVTTAVLQVHADYFAARAPRSVPGTVQRGKNIPSIFFRKGRCSARLGGIKSQLQRGRVGLYRHIRRDRLTRQIRALAAALTRILVIPPIIPRPAIETAFFNRRDIIRHQIVTETIPLIRCHPQFPSRRLYSEANRIADSRRINFDIVALGITNQHIGAIGFRRPRVAPSAVAVSSSADFRRGVFVLEAFRHIRTGSHRNRTTAFRHSKKRCRVWNVRPCHPSVWLRSSLPVQQL